MMKTGTPTRKMLLKGGRHAFAGDPVKHACTRCSAPAVISPGTRRLTVPLPVAAVVETAPPQKRNANQTLYYGNL